MAKKTPNAKKSINENSESITHSAKGFKAEKDFAESIGKYAGIPQQYYEFKKNNLALFKYKSYQYFKIVQNYLNKNESLVEKNKEKERLKRYYLESITPKMVKSKQIYKIDEICTSLKFYVGGAQFSENDVNFSFNYKINVGVQSKYYEKGEVDSGLVKHDCNQFIATPRLNMNILKNSILISEDLPKKHVKRLKEYGIKILPLDKFRQKFDVLLEMNSNSFSYLKYQNAKHEKYNFDLGELMLAESNFGNNINFINYIDLESISTDFFGKKIGSVDEKIENLLSCFHAQKIHLNPQYYIYSTKTGKIGREGRDYLKDINAKDCTYIDFENILSKGEFFNNFEVIKTDAYAIKDIVNGIIRWEMLDRVKQELRKDEQKIAHKKIQRAIDSLVCI